MKKRIAGKQLRRTSNERKSLIANLVTDLILRGSITTTNAKAMLTKQAADRLTTIAKTGGMTAMRLVMARLRHQKAAERLVFEIAPLLKDRHGGYLRLLKVKNRKGDNAPQTLITWVVQLPVKAEVVEAKPKTKKDKAKVVEKPKEAKK